MMKTKLVIADCDTKFTCELSRYLERYPEFEVVGIAQDGQTALELVRRKHPELLLTDMLLPKLDGICLLKSLHKMSGAPMTICFSDFYSHSSIENARNNGASYYIFKPIELPELVSILREYANLISQNRRSNSFINEAKKEREFASAIYEIVRSLGFSPKYSGSNYIVESVLLACESPMILRNLSKELYFELAFRLHTTAACIERSIRTAITAANQNGRLARIIGETPTNKRCIQYIVNELKARQ